ncbi:hypothetical protein FOYG_10214 [Fusarium oxysporum NRRL 32931]|uniref:Uncharacterized protein n=1 Tax=Fusarium oxysporum NRRL 32931 TaxID=660029 RepID=W9I7P6_FUSOX|nr:hypothetical protein FOYG_10214 [Fusarium oxysporum NRRL 32931]EWY89335.1 hypothetical protein FOYG_10214 [Fusarium oxysporum NRRL 32931]
MHPAAASATRRREQAQNPRTRSGPRFGALETPNHSPAQCNALIASTDCSVLVSNKRDDNPSSVTLIDDWIIFPDTNSTQRIAIMVYVCYYVCLQVWEASQSLSDLLHSCPLTWLDTMSLPNPG